MRRALACDKGAGKIRSWVPRSRQDEEETEEEEEEEEEDASSRPGWGQQAAQLENSIDRVSESLRQRGPLSSNPLMKGWG